MKKTFLIVVFILSIILVGKETGVKDTNSMVHCYEWGCFKDNFNGTISFSGKGDYDGINLVWMKCSLGQEWNRKNNDCTGTGKNNIKSKNGAKKFQFCSQPDDSCLDTEGNLNGNGNSEVFVGCNNLNNDAGYANIKKWRAPTVDEQRALINCKNKTMPALHRTCGSGNYDKPAINSLFPNTVASYYWSSSSPTNGSYAWNTNFESGYTSDDVLDIRYYVRCVASIEN